MGRGGDKFTGLFSSCDDIQHSGSALYFLLTVRRIMFEPLAWSNSWCRRSQGVCFLRRKFGNNYQAGWGCVSVCACVQDRPITRGHNTGRDALPRALVWSKFEYFLWHTRGFELFKKKKKRPGTHWVRWHERLALLFYQKDALINGNGMKLGLFYNSVHVKCWVNIFFMRKLRNFPKWRNGAKFTTNSSCSLHQHFCLWVVVNRGEVLDNVQEVFFFSFLNFYCFHDRIYIIIEFWRVKYNSAKKKKIKKKTGLLI